MVERKRHLAKAVSYRVFGSLATAAIAYLFSGRLDIAAGVGIADTVVKIILYYLHERVWYRIRWGVHPGIAHEHTQHTLGAAAEAQPPTPPAPPAPSAPARPPAPIPTVHVVPRHPAPKRD